MHNASISYVILLCATASLGIGFGLTVPTLNTLTALFFPQKVDSAILILNALLGLGTALAPLLVALFIGLGFWWGLPLLLSFLILGLILFSIPLPFMLKEVNIPNSPSSFGSIPHRFWVFAGFAFLYGVIETLNGNWATIYMRDLKASATTASLALTSFWAMTTGGRILFAAIDRYFPEKLTFRTLPFIAAAAFLLLANLPPGDGTLGIAAFGLAGLGCSALLPLTISFGTEELTSIATSVAGGLIAFYLLGYGVAAFGAGSLIDLTGISLRQVFGISSLLAVSLGILSFAVVRYQTLNNNK